MQMLKKFGTLEGPFVFDESEGETPSRVLVLLHGWGADGRDLADLGVPLQHMLPDLALWCPNGPAPCSANPMGRQWFELTDQFLTRPEAALEEMSDIAYLIEAAIDALCDEMGLMPQDIILGGFSQGGMMSLHMANQGRLQAAGFASLSGALVGGVHQPDDGPHHILLAHGTKDEVVPFAASREAQSLLEDAGHHVDFLARDGLGHGIDMAVLDALGQFAHMVTETS